MANKHKIRCSIAMLIMLIIRELQIKTTMRLSPYADLNGHHQKNLQTINSGEDVKEMVVIIDFTPLGASRTEPDGQRPLVWTRQVIRFSLQAQY